jgi:hypothetical protein
MTHEPIEKLIAQMALPTITILMVSALYNLVDTCFAGSLGTGATAAVGVSFSLMAVIQAAGFFFGHGGGNSVSRALGAHGSHRLCYRLCHWPYDFIFPLADACTFMLSLPLGIRVLPKALSS